MALSGDSCPGRRGADKIDDDCSLSRRGAARRPTYAAGATWSIAAARETGLFRRGDPAAEFRHQGDARIPFADRFVQTYDCGDFPLNLSTRVDGGLAAAGVRRRGTRARARNAGKPRWVVGIADCMSRRPAGAPIRSRPRSAFSRRAGSEVHDGDRHRPDRAKGHETRRSSADPVKDTARPDRCRPHPIIALRRQRSWLDDPAAARAVAKSADACGLRRSVGAAVSC